MTRRHLVKYLARSVLALVVIAGLGVVAVGRALSAGCANTVQRRVPSPDARHDLVVFERDCGATTDYSTQVSIVRAGAKLPDEAGNVYTYGHRAPVQVGWVSSAEAFVRYPPGFRGTREESRAAGIGVRYAEDSTVRAP